MAWVQELWTVDAATSAGYADPDSESGVPGDWLAIVCRDGERVAWVSYAEPDIDPHSRVGEGVVLVDRRG